MTTERLRHYAYMSVAALGGGALVYILLKYALLPTLPFLIAWAIAFALRAPSAYLGKRIKVPERIIRAILTLLVTLGALAAVFFLVWLLARELFSFLVGLGEGEILGEIVGGIFGGGFFDRLFGELGDRVEDAAHGMLSSVLSQLGGFLTVWVGAVPKAFLFIIITVVASVFFALDLGNINDSVRRIIPERAYTVLVRFKERFFSLGVKYIRSYLTLMLITFCIMLVGLALLGSRYALLLAIVISLLDFLPIIGVGTVLVPWSVISLVLGDTKMGLGILALLVFHELVRQVAEPKILGKNLGVHPLVTLILLYVGYAVFGFLGLLLVPVFTVILDICFNKEDTSEVA